MFIHPALEARRPFPPPIVDAFFKRPLLERRLHTDCGSGIIFYDDELDVAGGVEHNHAGYYLADCLRRVAIGSRMEWLVDNPVWYWEDESCKKQKVFYNDLALAQTQDAHRVTADELSLVVEVVTTTEKRKEKKDTVTSKARNEFHGVREFVLYYPNADDERSLVWHVHDGKAYQVVSPDAEGCYASVSLPGVVVRVLPLPERRGCEKVDVYYHGRRLARAAELEESLLFMEREAKADAKKSKKLVKQAENRVQEAESRAKVAEERAKAAEERAKAVERELEEVRRRFST